jgi:hypothetical protein
MRSYNEAIADLKTPDKSRARALVTFYKSSVAYEELEDSTKRNWTPWLDRIAAHFGKLGIAQFDRPDKIRPIIRR